MHRPENNCPELTEKTAYAIDDASLAQIFISTQKNKLDLCVKSALKWELLKNQFHTNWSPEMP